MKLTFALILLTLKLSSQSITYIPSYDNGYLDVKSLNNAIFLTALQADSETIDLVIPKGVYYIPNNQTIHMNNMVNLSCDSVTFVYKWESDEYKQNIIQFQDRTKAGISGLTIDFRQAYRDNKPTYSNAVKFTNRSIIQIEHSEHIKLQNVTILKIIGSGIELSNSNNCTIKNCLISGSWVLGAESGVMGYSINIVGTMSHDNLIEGNILKDARHLVILQYGCFNNTVTKNKTSGAGALKKVWFLEVVDRNWTYDISGHGNSMHDNIISGNECEGNLYLDNIKTTPNGPGNKIIGNTVKGRLNVESKAPYYDYNSGQILKNNKYGSMRIEAKDCINENNTRIK